MLNMRQKLGVGHFLYLLSRKASSLYENDKTIIDSSPETGSIEMEFYEFILLSSQKSRTKTCDPKASNIGKTIITWRVWIHDSFEQREPNLVDIPLY